MPGKMGDWLKNQIIDTILRRQFWGGPNVSAQDWHLSLLVEDPSLYPESGFFVYPRAAEVVYTGYARQRANATNLSWRRTDGDNTTADSTGSSGYTSVGTRLYFPLCTTSTQVVTHVGLMDSLTPDPAANYCYAYWQLQFPIQLQNAAPGFYPVIADESLRFQFS